MGLLDRILGRRSRIAIARAGEGVIVRIGGTVGCAAPLVAPYTGRSCAYWRLEILQQQADATTTGTAFEATSFTVDDGTGLAEILAERCTFDVISNYVEMERATHLSRKAHDLVSRYAWGPFADIAQVNIREAIVAIGEDIEIEGAGVREPDTRERGERGYREGASTRLVLSTGTRVRGMQREAVFVTS